MSQEVHEAQPDSFFFVGCYLGIQIEGNGNKYVME